MTNGCPYISRDNSKYLHNGRELMNNMDFITVSVLTTTMGADIVSELLMELGSGGTQIEDRADVAINQRPEGQWDIIDPAIAERMGEDVKVTGFFEAETDEAALIARVTAQMDDLRNMDLGFDLGKLSVTSETNEGEDWSESWKQNFTAFRLGNHMVVKPSWADADEKEGDKIIKIDPGMAFGTGTHETTGLCVQLIEQYVKPGMRVIDVGTGTGILAIAARHMGAVNLLATDIDPVAVRVAAENIRINGMEDHIRSMQGDLLECVDETCDVMIANIIADVIVMLCAPVRKHIVDGGMFICSGIAQDREDEVVAALKSAGYADLDIRAAGEWRAIACKK